MRLVQAVVGIPAVLALLAPGAPSQLFGGVPLSAAGIVCAAALLYALVALPPPGWRIARWLALGFAVVLALKLVAMATTPPTGLVASYWAKPTADGAAERSTEYPRPSDGTRIERALDLRGDDFDVYFFNDASRFNFGSEVTPGRDQLPFTVRWHGFLAVDAGGERRFTVESNGPARVWLDGAELDSADARVSLTPGVHELHLEYTRPEARVPRLSLKWERTPGGPLEVVGAPEVRWQPSVAGAAVSDSLGAAADWLLAVLGLGWVALGLREARSGGIPRAVLGAIPLGFLAHGLLLHAPLIGRTTILSGLDDWLVYESSARDIVLNGLLMDGGQGRATPFYGQPLYPYALALVHLLTGESLFGALALQYAALGLVAVLTGVLAYRSFGGRVDAIAAVACFSALLQIEAEHFKVARQLFNENLYMPLVMASLVVVVGLAKRAEPPPLRKALVVGLLLGATAISRSQFLLFVPFGLMVLLLAWRRAAAAPLLAMVAGLLVAIAPVTARNFVVSGQLVPISSSGGASLLEFHRPPPGLLDMDAVQKDPVYDALRLDAATRTVVAFARADPGGYIATLAPLGAHSIGLQGRNDPGIYWPLFATCLLYVASFGFKQTRRLHMWPIHAFVATHLLVLMLFEADTYGYRLVMPMYAPMVAVAAQVPLVLTRAAVALRERRMRYAAAAWSAVAVAALVWQARGMAEIWPQREVQLHGLGGAAAHAAETAYRTQARAIYVASVDGTPRRFGAGFLSGLRYPWFKWFDPSRSLPLAAPNDTAVYALSELVGHSPSGDLTACLGAPDPFGEHVVDGAEARRRCVIGAISDGILEPRVTFDGMAEVAALAVPPSAEAGEPLEARLLWQPLVTRPDPQLFSLHVIDPELLSAGAQTGNATLELYPASQWQPGEWLLSRLVMTTDPTALPQSYRLTLGVGSTRANVPPSTALWQGVRTDRVPLASVALTPAISLAYRTLPTDMRPLDGPPLLGGGLELVGARPLPSQAAVGGPLKIGLLWRALRDAPEATQLRVRLIRSSGEVVQESVVPLLGGRVMPSTLREGSVVRDEQALTIEPRVPLEPLVLEVDVLDARARLGTVTMTGRAHAIDRSVEADPTRTFGGSMQLVGDTLEPAEAGANQKVRVSVRWLGMAEMTQAYKVFVHVLDPSSQHVVAQRDSEPRDGDAPTTSWIVGEVIDDAYEIALPASMPAGDYPMEIGIYDPRSGNRLLLPDGDNRIVLSTRLRVR